MSPKQRKRRPGNPDLAVGYIRVSTGKQELSPDVQRADIEAWAARQKVKVVAWHVDQGVGRSEGLDGRPDLGNALRDVQEYRAGLLAVSRRDRLGGGHVTAVIEHEVERLGARVASADGVANGDTPADRMQRGILDAVNGHERELVGVRTRAALAAKRRRGELVSRHPPFGWAVVPAVSGPDGRRVEPARLVADPAEQAILSEVRELRAEGLTLRAIASELAANGVTSRAGRPFALPQVAKMARSAQAL